MIVHFLCSRLAPGRDGVGDYCRRLALACQERGASCQLISLNEKDLNAPQKELQEGIPTLRLPATLEWGKRQALVRNLQESSPPGVTSFQFVGYGYSPKGILPREFIQLSKTCAPGRRHVMMHELWIGAWDGAPLKERLVGWLQKRRTLQWLGALRPACIHTSNTAYSGLLEREGFRASLLPLFGNIPLCTGARLPAEASLAHQTTKPLTALLFGTLHPQWRPDAFCKWFIDEGARRQQALHVLAAGRLGAQATALLASIRSHGIPVLQLGEQAPEQLSALMQYADFGVGVHPLALAGKSGVIAAMLDHGLPVLMPRDDWKPKGLPAFEPTLPQSLLPLKDATPERTQVWLQRRLPVRPSIDAVAEAFLQGVRPEET